MIEVAKAHERTCQEYQIHKQAHSMAPRTTPILCYKQVLCQSLFRKALPRRPVASVDIHTTTGNTLPVGLHAAAVTRRTTGLSNVEAPGEGTVHQVTHPPWEVHNRDKEDTVASSSTKAGDKEEEVMATSRDPLPRNQVLDEDMEGSHTILPPSQLLNSSQDQHTLPR